MNGVEYVLHSANNAQRIAEGFRAGFRRFDVDVRRRGGEIIVSHGFPVGPLILDVCGMLSGRVPKPCFHWQWRLPNLRDEILAGNPPPLLLDLKGRWSGSNLRMLHELLLRFDRRDDLIASQSWDALDRYAEIDARQRLVYSADTFDELARLIGRVHLGDVRIGGVSLNDQLVRAPGMEDRLRRVFRGVPLYVWGISSRERVAGLIVFGADGVIFSDPWIP